MIQKNGYRFKLLLILVSILGAQGVWADPEKSEVGEQNPAPKAGETQEVEKLPSKKTSPVNRKGVIPREKEAEGTQAPRRFDTVIPKSKYEVNGQSLEVDPD